MRIFFCLLVSSAFLLAPSLCLADFDELLRSARSSLKEDSLIHHKREKRFLSNVDEQQKLLKEAKANLAREKKKNASLINSRDKSEIELAKLEEKLHIRTGSLGEMFGIVRQVSGDFLALKLDSLVSSQKSSHSDFLTRLSKSSRLPSLSELEEFWVVLLEEMIESGRVISFKAPVVDASGRTEERDVVRVGVFTAVSDGHYLRLSTETGKLTELIRQPNWRYRRMARGLQSADDGVQQMVIDPTRGAFLGLLRERPSVGERINQGGIIGYIIIVLGLLGGGIAAWRYKLLSATQTRVKRQLETLDNPRPDNPLGRVLQVYAEHVAKDLESLEMHLDEAILKET